MRINPRGCNGSLSESTVDSSHSTARTNRKGNHSHQGGETNRSILPINNETEQRCVLLVRKRRVSTGDSYSKQPSLKMVFHSYKAFNFVVCWSQRHFISSHICAFINANLKQSRYVHKIKGTGV